jgi:hypothetical protein
MVSIVGMAPHTTIIQLVVQVQIAPSRVERAVACIQNLNAVKGQTDHYLGYLFGIIEAPPFFWPGEAVY